MFLFESLIVWGEASVGRGEESLGRMVHGGCSRPAVGCEG
jgi:hypothetical protein